MTIYIFKKSYKRGFILGDYSGDCFYNSDLYFNDNSSLIDRLNKESNEENKINIAREWIKENIALMAELRSHAIASSFFIMAPSVETESIVVDTWVYLLNTQEQDISSLNFKG